MKIAGGMILEYLTNATSIIGDIGGLPESISGYYEGALVMKDNAEKHNDLEALRLAIDYLIAHPEADAPSYAPIHYQYDDDEMRELLLYLRSVVYPNFSPIDKSEVENVSIIPMSVIDWWKTRRQQGLHPEHPQIETNISP